MDDKWSSVCGVVISYRPRLEIVSHLTILLGQLGHVVVVDNTPCLDATSPIDKVELLDRCTVIRNGRNLGIATALNIGYHHAIDLGFSWVITFDQDSQVPEGFVEDMLCSYQEATKTSPVGLVCPRYRDVKLRIILYTHRAKNGDVSASMTSGSMIHADTFRLLGQMEESFFIDYVDIEYCLRARSGGMKVIESANAILDHSLGRITVHRLLGKTFTTTNHSAKRRYYITRNRLVLIRRYFFKDREWAVGDLKGVVVDFIKICLAEDNKATKLAYMVRGTFDALFGRMGPRVEL